MVLSHPSCLQLDGKEKASEEEGACPTDDTEHSLYARVRSLTFFDITKSWLPVPSRSKIPTSHAAFKMLFDMH